MGALCLLPSTPPSCSGRGLASSPRPPRPLAPSASSWPRPQLAAGGGRRLAGVARARGEKGGKNGGAEFFREDGVVDDMDGYLNYLSLEYDSVWDTKPAWKVIIVGFVQWVDEQWPPTMENALLKVWSMVEESKSARVSPLDNITNRNRCSCV